MSLSLPLSTCRYGDLQPGQVVELTNGQNVMVVAQNDEFIKVDCNNPIAGMELKLMITLKKVLSPGADP